VEGPEHARVFTVESSIRGFSAIGRGRSKKEAEQEAAKNLVRKIQEA
ncbi:MAG: putative dsRNA-binding protein, partial [Aquificota bacterium]|nr:putative dsRNA-binding protein [Aquificota bacterium]